jgi:hypothetical protein
MTEASAMEDAATAIDLTAYTIADLDGDTIPLTLDVDRGILASTDGDGVYGGVTVVGSASASITLQGSSADLNGFQYWANLIDQGASVGDIVNGFLHSQEFVERRDINPGTLNSDQTLELYYTTLLGWDFDQEGYEFWQQYLQAGATHQDVLYGFVMSAEMQQYHQSAEQWGFLL